LKEKISGLIRLQDLDNRLKKVEQDQKEGPIKILELEDELNKREMIFDEENKKLEALKKERREIEQNVQDLDNKIEKSQIKLNNIKSNKEYSAVLKEIEDVNKQKTLTEDRVLQLMEEIDEMEKKNSAAQKEQEELRERFVAEKDAIEREMEDLDKELNELKKQREIFIGEVDQELLRNYQFLRERKGGVAITSAIGGICQECHIGLPPQKFNEIIRCHSLISCPNCNRIIYWGEDAYFTKVIDQLQ
jgi:predicted  nucleic acid-binding Zn-ribbon protein